jgi:hypothetical protein
LCFRLCQRQSGYEKNTDGEPSKAGRDAPEREGHREYAKLKFLSPGKRLWAISRTILAKLRICNASGAAVLTNFAPQAEEASLACNLHDREREK